MKERPPSPHLVTLTTDFGLSDGYVGSMKGVMLTIEDRLTIVDVTHDLPAHEVMPAALLLREVCPRFPEGTVHVGVVDPGVGSSRRPIVLEIAGSLYVGPDNGLFSLLADALGLNGAWLLENPRYLGESISSTFHGRDIFAPVGAHLARGLPRPNWVRLSLI